MQRGGNTPPRKKKPGRTPLPASQLTRPLNSPFAGISHTNAPARDTHIPELSAQVALAKARQQRTQQGGLLTPQQRKAEQEAAKVLANAKPAPRSKVPLKSAPVEIGAPPAPPLARVAQRTPAPPASPPSPGRRGAQPFNPRAGMAAAIAKQPKGQLLGPLEEAADAAIHGVDVGVGTTSLALKPSLIDIARHPVAWAENVKQRGLVSSEESAREFAKMGTQAVGKIPTSITVVPTSGAATSKNVTPEELKRLEGQGWDLAPRLRKKFLANAAKNGWNPAELDGISGSNLIDKAFTKPASGPLRVLGNFGAGVARLGTLPAGIEGAVRETAAGHGGEVAQALGEGLISELPVVGKHRAVDTAVADPFGFLTQFAGAGKTVGSVAGLARRGVTPRVVETASSGLKVERGDLAKNAYTATGQALSDAAARRIRPIGRRLEAEVVDKAVRRSTNKHSPAFVKAQRAYKESLDKVGHKRGAELLGYQMAGGKADQLATFYRAQGETGPAKFFDRVAKNTAELSDKDRAFLKTHAALAKHTGDTLIQTGKFGDTAARFRAYSPLIRSSARLGDPEAQRVLALREEYIKGFDVMPEEDLAALRGAIDQGVDDFAKAHAARGGSEPVRVEYTQPKPLIASPFMPGPGGAVGFKTPRGKQKAETGATFESGKFLLDPNSPLVESVRAQRQHLASVLHGEVADAVGQHLRAGDPIPPGHVFVSETNLRGLRRTTNDLADNPVSSPDYYEEEAGLRQRIFDQLKANTVPSGQRVPRGEKGYAIPEGSWRRILDHTRPPSRNAYDRLMKQYQRILVSYRPSTIVNNAVGSGILAGTAGAGPKSFVRAAQAMRDPELAPAVLRGRGVAGSLAPGQRSRVGAGMDFMRTQSARTEDFGRLAAFFAKAGPTFKKRASELNMSADEYQRALARGDVDPQRLDAFLDHAEKFVGDVAKPDGKLGRFASHGILFHRWLGHMAKLILFTLPVEHPRRLAILNTLADYGEQYRQEKGVWPEWYREYLPLFQSIKRVGPSDKAQVFTTAYSTQGVNPFSTLNQYANPVSANDSVKDIVFGVLSPPLQIAGRTIFDRPYDSTNAWRYLAGQTLRQVPGVSVIKPQGGMAPDSIPFISEQRKQYSSGRKVNGRTVPLPWDLRATARPIDGVLGGLLRYGVGGVYEVPAQGPIHAIDQKKHIGAKARDARKKR